MSKDKSRVAFGITLAIIDSIKMMAAWLLELLCIIGSIVTATASVMFVLDQQLREGILAVLIAVIMILIPLILTVTTGQSERKGN